MNYNKPLTDDEGDMPSVDPMTGVNLGFEHSIVHKFLIIFPFGDDVAVAHCRTNFAKLLAEFSWI